jgi:16S rRNA (adenine(1408)-N(1))-methyltransferase
VHVDFGAGDGGYALRRARRAADTLFFGVDAAADNLRAAARSAARKPARGGVANALFGRLALDDAPGALVALADHVTVLLPWGSLLRAVAVPELDGVRTLAAIGKPGAELRVVFGYGAGDPEARALGLPPLDDATRAALRASYASTGLDARLRLLDRAQVRDLGTTWATRLAFSSKPRTFVEISARFPAPAGSTPKPLVPPGTDR